MFDAHGAESLGKLTLNVLLPALLFTEMIKALDIEKFDSFAILLLFCSSNLHVAHIILGLGIGWVLATLTSASKNKKKLIIMCVAFQDTTAIPLIFAGVLGNSDVTKSDDDFKQTATSYVLIYTVFITVYKWTVAYA